MFNPVITSAALLAGATAVQAVGRAVVVNKCAFDVTMTNVPASGGGQSQIGPQQLSTGGTYSQQWTSLSNDQGWSMKLSVGGDMVDIVQYEYTYHNDGVIWYDLSAVNGDPFDGDWYITADNGCQPRQAAYRYPTDDEFGMQSSCPDSSTITVTLCNSAGGAAPAPDSSPSQPDSSPAPVVPAPEVPAPSVPSPSVPLAAPSVADPNVPEVPVETDVTGGRFGPPADKVANPDGFQQLQATPAMHTVTNVRTEIVTHFVTVVPSPAPHNRRHEHLHRHAERHNHF